MLQQMRDGFRYLKWLLVIVIFMFVVWAAASWTGGSGKQEQSVDWAATINGEVIESTSFQSYARQLDSTYQSLFGEQYAQQRGLIKIGRQAINQLVDEELLYQEAARQGLRVSPDEVAQAITRDPNFQENGRFIGVERYRSLFRAGRLGIGQFEEQMRRRLLIEKYRNLIGNGVAVTDAEVEREFLRRNQKMTVDYVVIDPARLPQTPRPDEAGVTRFYEAHKDRYQRGPGRTGIYVLVNPRDLAPRIEVAEAEVQAAYDRDRATRYATPEQRRASHVLFKLPAGASDKEAARIEAKARGVLKQARSGADFADLARRYSEDTSSAAGGDLNFFGRGQMVKEFDHAAFSQPVGSVGDLVKTTFGFHIIKVTDAREARTMPFDEVRDRIRDELRMGRARSQSLDRAQALATAASSGTLDAVARSQGLTVVDTGAVHESDALPGVPASQPVVARMLTLEPGQVSDVIPIPSGQVVVQVTATVPDEPRPLAEVRPRVEKELAEEHQIAAVRDAARGAGGGSGLRSLAKQFKTEVKTQADLSRGGSLTGVPGNPAIDRQLETLPPRTLGDPVATPAGIVLLTIRERSDHRDEFAAQKDSTRDNLVTQERDRLLRAVVRRLRAQGEVSINDTLVDSIDRS